MKKMMNQAASLVRKRPFSTSAKVIAAAGDEKKRNAKKMANSGEKNSLSNKTGLGKLGAEIYLLGGQHPLRKGDIKALVNQISK